ncbi:hypothetical protein VSU01S_11250 [Vibrio superstes NBRC 103154]|uniref:Uncharacterized protein n=1 Tax=Vibrio superstes NBRC 103154 TaxID=1219062 RepID=A0A511QNJ8_9VIBR|nr:hypothetical protein VSU01S_11250 [Vibrio superstes NBRC 103154]
MSSLFNVNVGSKPLMSHSLHISKVNLAYKPHTAIRNPTFKMFSFSRISYQAKIAVSEDN